MKKLVLTLFVMFSATVLFAQSSTPSTPSTPAPKTKESKTTVTHTVAVKNYCCPDCDYVSAKPGTCPHHNKALIREGMYYCPDGKTSHEPGSCADGSPMAKMVDKTKKAKTKTDDAGEKSAAPAK
jgi:hypothetical protein